MCLPLLYTLIVLVQIFTLFTLQGLSTAQCERMSPLTLSIGELYLICICNMTRHRPQFSWTYYSTDLLDRSLVAVIARFHSLVSFPMSLCGHLTISHFPLMHWFCLPLRVVALANLRNAYKPYSRVDTGAPMQTRVMLLVPICASSPAPTP